MGGKEKLYKSGLTHEMDQ